MNLLTNDLTVPPPVNFPVVSGGFALLATTGALAAGLGGPAGAAAGGAALTVGGVVTGLVPLVAAGALGVLGEKYLIIFVLNNIISVYCLLSGVSTAMCVGPLYCTTPGGQCCLLALDQNLGALVCPLSCSN